MVNLKQALTYIDPSSLDYEEWLEIGMGLKSAADNGENITWNDWDSWSITDSRYEKGVCRRKWNSFNSTGISKGTIIYRAMQNGFKPFESLGEFDWDDVVSLDKKPKEEGDFSKFIKAVYEPNELVSFVTESRQNDKGKYYPAGPGTYGVNAQKLIDSFSKNESLEDAIGDYDHNAGVWVRINPMDGKGISDSNVSKFKYTLIESDETSIDSQLEMIYKLRLPCVAITYSGGRSIHALVKVGAKDKEEYKSRVEFIYKKLESQDFIVDKNNKNASRMTRLPGADRGEEVQSLIDINTGYYDFETWREFAENNFNEIELPEIESFEELYNNMPELAPELIEGVLRQGHKMLLAGSSKAGKSFSLIELGVALAEGGEWFGFKCKKSKVLYINLEIDRSSFAHRVKGVYEELGIEGVNKDNFRIWNLRGKSQPMQKLTPKIIRRLRESNYNVIILDPVYKVQSGDENAAGDIAAFTNEFDRLTTELGVSLIYCHHHSKGNQGGKRAIDRASGSGVFARDPDAILDMIELENTSYQSNEKYRDCSAWRIEGTLREFPPFEPVNLFFRFPLHEVDTEGLLDDAEIRDYTFKSNRGKKSDEDRMDEFDTAFIVNSDDGRTAQEKDMMSYFQIGRQAFRKRLNQYNKIAGKQAYKRYKGVITRTENW